MSQPVNVTCTHAHGYAIETYTGRILYAGHDFGQAVTTLAGIDLDTGPEAYAVAIHDNNSYCISASQAIEVAASKRDRLDLDDLDGLRVLATEPRTELCDSACEDERMAAGTCRHDDDWREAPLPASSPACK